MTLDEIRHHIEIEAETLIKPQSKAIFKKILDPYFEEVSAFKKNLDADVLKLKKEIDKHLKKNTKSKFLDMRNSPGKDYIKCCNSSVTLDALNFDIYYPTAEHEYIWGWIPQKAYKNDPLPRLLSYAGWKPNGQNLTMLQFATVAILYDVPNIENGCNLIYFGSGDDLADRVASRFMGVIKNDGHTIITPCGRKEHKRVIARLKNAFDTVKIKLGDGAGGTGLNKLPAKPDNIINSIQKILPVLDDWMNRTSANKDLGSAVDTTELRLSLVGFDRIISSIPFQQTREDVKKAWKALQGILKINFNRTTAQEIIECVLEFRKQLDLCKTEIINDNQTPAETGQGNKAINKLNAKSPKIFGDKFVVWGLSINYKNFWHKIKDWPCAARGIKKIRNFFRR